MTTLRSAIARVPRPLRVIFAVWALISVGFNISSPLSTANLSPAVRFVVLLPAALVSLGLAIYMIWQGGLTLLRTLKFATGMSPTTDDQSPSGGTVIGGIGALNIYMLGFFGAAFGLAQVLATYTVSVALSVGVVMGMIFILFTRKALPRDVKIFLWGAASITLLFGILMVTIAAPPAPTI